MVARPEGGEKGGEGRGQAERQGGQTGSGRKWEVGEGERGRKKEVMVDRQREKNLEHLSTL